MTIEINLNYDRRPGGLYTVFLAFKGISKTFNSKEPFPKIKATRKGVVIEKKHLEKFNSICTIDQESEISLIYPFTFIYPLLQRMLCHKEAPLSLFQVLNTRMEVTQYRRINTGETLDIVCEIIDHRVVEKGLEIYIKSVIESEGKPVWENRQTFYYRGEFGEPDQKPSWPGFESLKNPELVESWFLQNGTGLGFARISGDGNPIHYFKKWAQIFGFERDFSQPLLVLANSVFRLEKYGFKDPVSLDVSLKGPVYYGGNVMIKINKTSGDNRFDLYSGTNQRPSICGELKIR